MTLRAMCETGTTRTGRCPQCGRAFQYDATARPKWLPFCSDRCQWADLGRWLDGEFCVSKDLLGGDDEQTD